MKALRNAAILTALGATAAAIVFIPPDSPETATVPGVVVTPRSAPSAVPTGGASTSAAPQASPADTATPDRPDQAGQAAVETNGDAAAPAPAEAPAPAAPAPPPVPAAPAPAPVPQVPVSVPQAPALSSVCEWDDDDWECDDDWDNG